MHMSRYPVLYEERMDTVLVQEMSCFNHFTAVMKDSLRNISLAIQSLLVSGIRCSLAVPTLQLPHVPHDGAQGRLGNNGALTIFEGTDRPELQALDP